MTKQTEDEEFAKFLEIARKDTLTDDDSKALQETLKAHPQWLKDQTKTDQFFPQPVYKPGKNGTLEEMTKSEACGFENTACIRNVINAAVAIHNEKDADGNSVLSDDAFGNFMNTTDSKTGRNFATVVSRNMAANEFKAKKAKSPAIKDVLDNNHESLAQTLEIIKAASPDLMETKDGNAVQATKYVEYAAKNAELNVTPQTNEETYQIGGNANDLNVTQAQPVKPALNVNAEETEEDNMANVQPAENEDPGKGEKAHFDRVKEQDIIDFMFNDWFLASINWAMEKVYNMADSGINKLCTAYQPTPKATANAQQQAAAQAQPAPASGNGQDGASGRATDAAAMQQMFNKAINDLTINNATLTDRFEAIVKDIQNNADKNRKPQDWQTTVLNPNNPKHKVLMDKCTKLSNSDPESFKKLLKNKETLLASAVPMLVGEIRMAAAMAVYAYTSDPKNLGKPLDEEALTEIRGRQKMILNDMKKTRDIILQHNIDEYRTTHHLDANAKIDDNTMSQIKIEAVGQYHDYMNSVANSAIALKENLTNYFNADDKTEARSNLDKSRKEFMDNLSSLGNIPKENDRQPQPRTQNKDANPQDLQQEAIETNKAEKYEQKTTAEQNRNREAENNDRKYNNDRKRNFDNHKNPTHDTKKPNTNTFQPDKGRSL
ncbi:MAG: hypothetical protein J6N49_03635 [Alphaproteobacteria bacterium]|nr:hypothetical protein [Alphaproteobacteria bacterium]